MSEAAQIIFAFAFLVAAFALLHYLVGRELTEHYIDSIRATLGTAYRRGWRPAIGWISIYTFAGLAYRIAHGLPLGDAVPLAAALVPLGTALIAAVGARCIEYIRGVANSPMPLWPASNARPADAGPGSIANAAAA